MKYDNLVTIRTAVTFVDNMENELLRLCSSKDFNEEKFLEFVTTEGKQTLEASDEHGMTCLMHSAFNGHLLACEKLIFLGAEVNSSTHKDGYSALMFGAIAGRRDIVEILLRAGARTSLTNNIGKTAAAMAAFAGQHECALLINNFLSVSEMAEYCGRGLLPDSLTTPLHSLLTSINIHPVKLLLQIQTATPLLQDVARASRVLAVLCRGLVNDHREGLALKAHYLSFLITLAHKHGSNHLLKRLLTCTATGEWVELDLILRQCLREYTHVHTTLLQHMVAALAKTTPGKSPSAYSIFVSAIVGDKSAEAVSESCCVCGSLSALKRCSKCKKVSYCSVDCQRLAWSTGNHKSLCKKWSSVPDTT